MAQAAAALPLVNDSTLPVVETFHSLQGEGIHAGRSAFFIRLAGCTVGCSWCDTKHSWPEKSHLRCSLTTLAEEASAAIASGAAFVVITGGEPLHHNLSPLCQALRAHVKRQTGRTVPLHLETSGVDALSGHFDWITLSPKRHKPPTDQLLAACHELKVVVHGPEDLSFASEMAMATQTSRMVNPANPAQAKNARNQQPVLLLQPGHDSEEGRGLAVAHTVAHPEWRLSLQLHKLLGLQ